MVHASQIISTLNPLRHQILWRIPTKSRTVYLTFDDGPHADLTGRFLAILAEYNIKASFFLCGNRVAKAPELAREILSQGHTVASHGYDHIRLIGRRRQTLQQQVLTADRVIKSATQVTPRYFRPPYGIFGPGLLSVLREINKILILWNCNSYDYRRNYSPEKILSRVTIKIQPGSIILLHDGPPHGYRTVELLPDIVQMLRDDGYNFAALPDRNILYQQM